MIRPYPFLDPRGRPVDGQMEMIGGPRDGEMWPATAPAPQHANGRYLIADTLRWSFVWVPEQVW